jgi:lipopolysaccharide/colanic/teichoic acid biosynthesis glycosyltransferase
MQNIKNTAEFVGHETLAATRISLWQAVVKRAIDIVGSAIALVLLSPLLVGIACAIWWQDGRPILYRWRVVGKDGNPFLSWKFRSMKVNADSEKKFLESRNEMSGPVFKMASDPRVTKLGRLLRRLSFDELPQFWSVLKGDMSLVGPRPPLVEEYARFEEWQKQKLSVTPGMTCLWQVSGRSDIKDFNEWVRMDLDYIRDWSLWADFKIMLRTIAVMVSGRGAY